MGIGQNPVEKSSKVLVVTRRRVIKREELVEERNRREGRGAILRARAFSAGSFDVQRGIQRLR